MVLQVPKDDAGDKVFAAGLNITHAADLLEIRTGDLHHTLQQLIACGANLDRLRIRAWTLDDLFINVTGKALRPGS